MTHPNLIWWQKVCLAPSDDTWLTFWPDDTQDYSLLHLPLCVETMILKTSQWWVHGLFLVVAAQLQLGFTAQVSVSCIDALYYCSLDALPCIYWYWGSSAPFFPTHSVLWGFPGVSNNLWICCPPKTDLQILLCIAFPRSLLNTASAGTGAQRAELEAEPLLGLGLPDPSRAL